MMRLHTVGRVSGKPRVTMLGFYEDGPNLVTIAMNGWAKSEPQWWLNLRARPDTTVDLPDGTRKVRAHIAEGAERERLWNGLSRYRGWGEDLDALASQRGRETTVVVLEPA
jgi:deazaflavin-dependent oxidoreductase (nitroreductase family)